MFALGGGTSAESFSTSSAGDSSTDVVPSDHAFAPGGGDGLPVWAMYDLHSGAPFRDDHD